MDKSNKSTPMENIYNVGVTTGHIFALIFAIFCTIFFIVSLIVGIKLLNQSPSHLTSSSDGVVKLLKDSCIKSNPTSNTVLYRCNITVEYIVGKDSNGQDIKLTKDFNTSSNIEYQQGNVIKVHYNPNMPTESAIGTQISPKTSGTYLIIGGVCALLFGWIIYFLVKKNEGLAAIVGIGELGNIIFK